MMHSYKKWVFARAKNQLFFIDIFMDFKHNFLVKNSKKQINDY